MYKYTSELSNISELITPESLLQYVGGEELLRNTSINELNEIVTEASLYFKVPRNVIAQIIDELLNEDKSLSMTLKRIKNK